MTDKISLQMEGPEKNDNHLELSVFSQKVKQFLDLLVESAKEDGNNSVKFRIVNLSHSSPAIIECEPVSEGGQYFPEAIENIGQPLKCVQEGKTENLSNPCLSAIEKFAKFKPEQIASAEVSISYAEGKEKNVYRLNDEFRKNLGRARLMEERVIRENLGRARLMEERVISTIDGKLERIDIHGNANKFRIYTTIPNMPSVTCTFPQELLEKVRESLGFFVSVSGKCFYRSDEMFPYKVDVGQMRILPDPEKLPSLEDLYGISPNTEGKSSEQFVREIRDEWGDSK